MTCQVGTAGAVIARHVAVTSDQSLVADTISAALSGPGLVASRVPWRGGLGARVPAPRPVQPYAVGVLLSDLQPLVRLAEAQRALQDIPVPWLVLTGARRGPLWGAMLESGARAVLRSTISLEELRDAIDRVGREDPILPAAEVTRLVRSWREVVADRRHAVENLRSLSPREADVLALMHAGQSVTWIAGRSEVSETTVRSQVRAVLQKLGVRSQLAAVAAYDAASAELEELPLE